MSERITRENVEERAANVNRRIRNTGRRVIVEARNGRLGLDEYVDNGSENLIYIRTITVGTKREVADFLHAMMVGIDLSRGQ